MDIDIKFQDGIIVTLKYFFCHIFFIKIIKEIFYESIKIRRVKRQISLSSYEELKKGN
jgi:hypothetical protein